MGTDGSGLVSIIIVNWNTRDILLQCLDSVYRTSKETLCEVIVVDNASTDGSADAVSQHFPDVSIVRNDKNVGFAAANNLAIKAARGEYLLFLNPDTVVCGDAISEMRDFLAKDKEVGAVGCRLANADGSTQESYWFSFPCRRWLLEKVIYWNKVTQRISKKSNKLQEPFPVAHLLGACIMCPASLVKQLSGFDESYFLYLEETDLCWRIREAGYAVFHLPGASVIHYGQQSSNQAAEWASLELYRNTYRFIRGHSRWQMASRLLTQWIIAMLAIVRVLLWTVRRITGVGNPDTARRMTMGFWRLLLAVPGFERECKRRV
ncbi:MAG: glycosyltransferase family 2 protein [Armatimonadota bacterium]|nr:glycosyltransferase family 2 protein [bacterium]